MKKLLLFLLLACFSLFLLPGVFALRDYDGYDIREFTSVCKDAPVSDECCVLRGYDFWDDEVEACSVTRSLGRGSLTLRVSDGDGDGGSGDGVVSVLVEDEIELSLIEAVIVDVKPGDRKSVV